MKFICHTCSLNRGVIAVLSGSSAEIKTLGLFKAIWHRLKGHHVTRAWKPSKDAWQDYLPRERIPRQPLSRPGDQAKHQDLSKFFKGKGGRKTRLYRKSIKEKKKPEKN